MAEHREATLDELLSEPIILTVMASDGVRSSDVRRLLRQVGAREQQSALEFAGKVGRRQARAFEGPSASL